jgi:hypothetical protein
MLRAYVFSSGHFRDLLSSKKDKDGHSRGEPQHIIHKANAAGASKLKERCFPMKIVALYDIHGNLPALDAVLKEVEHENPDVILVGVISLPAPCRALP